MRFRIIPNLEKNLRLLSFSQTNYGKACILAIYLTGLHSVASWLFPWIIAPYLIFTFASRFRSLALTITTLSALAVNLKNFLPFDIVKFDQLALTRWEWELFGIYILILALFFFYIRVYRRFSKTHLKHPFLVLMLAFIASCALLSNVQMHPTLQAYAWIFVLIFGKFIWQFGYALADDPHLRNDPYFHQIGAYRPFWYSTAVPIPKGFRYLKEIEAKNSEELAISQLKGIKLFLWYAILNFFLLTLNAVFHGDKNTLRNWIAFEIPLPTMQDLFKLQSEGKNAPFYSFWLAAASTFFLDALFRGVQVHLAVSMVRMAGYNALRGMYKPFSANSIHEFYNRYSYYFKEVLVHTFFYPTYFTCFKKQKKLRLFFAIFMAAGVGNFLLHFLSETGYITNDGFFTHFRNFHVYWFHVTILSLGIYVSQNRNSGKKDAPRKGALPRAIASTGSMILFYIFLTVFDVSRANVPRGLSLYDHFRYLGAMFGVNY